MRPVDCEACHRPQPKDWLPGQRCIHCGGAVRTETRCAACTHWTPAGRFCRHCAAELVPDEWYGPARMLVAAGVDGLSLAGRVAALDPAQREAFSSRFAVQRAVVEQLVQEARFAESFLLTRGHADALEERLLAELPWKPAALEDLKDRPQGPFDTPEQLEVSRARSPLLQTRSLAALALARRGDARREVLDDVRLHLDEGPLGVEALVAAARADVVPGADLFNRATLETAERLLPALRTALPQSTEAALTEAVLLRRRHRDVQPKLETAGLVPRLREGLSSSDVVIRFGCAELLGDADTLDALVDEPRVREQALRALSGLGSPHLVRRLRAAADDDARRELLRRLRTPLDALAFEAVTELAGATTGELQRDALRVLMRTPWSEVDPAARAGLDRWAGRQGFEVELALDLLHWAASTGSSKRPWRSLDEVQPYAVAAARALSLAPKTTKTLRLHHLDDFFAVALDGRPLECVVEWLQHEQTRDEALRRVFSLQGVLASYAEPPDDRGVRLLFTAWERLGDEGRARLAAPFAEVFRRDGGSQSRDVVLQAFWERFLAHPAERAAIWQATRWSRRELEALRDADPRAQELDGGDPARRFGLYGALDPLGAPELLHALCDAPGQGQALTGLTPTVLSVAATLFEAGEHRHAMWLAASWMSQVVNRFRDDETREAWRETAMALTDAHGVVLAKRAATTPKDPGDSLRSFEEQLETELRLAREVVGREEETRARERQRTAEREAREADQRRAAEERAAEQARRDDEARRQLDAARQALSVHTAAVADAGGGDALDTEVLVPDQPLRTLRDYVAFMRAMRGGADVMALFAQYELTPTSWGACAGAWATVMTQRMDVAMRFAKLLG